MGLTDYLHSKKPVGSTTPERASASGHRFSVGSSSSTGIPSGGANESSSAPADDVSVLGEDEGNVLMSLIKQVSRTFASPSSLWPRRLMHVLMIFLD
jgi:hypothetical protein